MQVQKPRRYEMHLCPTGTCPHAWDDVAPELHVHHKDDRCPKCNAHRFVNAHGSIQPSRRCGCSITVTGSTLLGRSRSIKMWTTCWCRAWVVPVHQVVQSFFDDAEFRAHVSTNRDAGDPTSIFNSEAMKRLDMALGGALQPDRQFKCIPFDGGGDGVQVRSQTRKVKWQACPVHVAPVA
jgi:hypothetical protein